MTVYTDPLGSLETEMRGRSVRIPAPCIYCGAQEKWDADEQRYENIVHDFSKHPGFAIRESQRMESEELFGSVDSQTLDKLGGRREA